MAVHDVLMTAACRVAIFGCVYVEWILLIRPSAGESEQTVGSTEIEAVCLLALIALLLSCSTAIQWREKLLEDSKAIEVERQVVISELAGREALIWRGGTAVLGACSGRYNKLYHDCRWRNIALSDALQHLGLAGYNGTVRNKGGLHLHISFAYGCMPAGILYKDFRTRCKESSGCCDAAERYCTSLDKIVEIFFL
eukprot:scaffold615811_cov32-Prasinocladus_malaysianus.AAC.1